MASILSQFPQTSILANSSPPMAQDAIITRVDHLNETISALKAMADSQVPVEEAGPPAYQGHKLENLYIQLDHRKINVQDVYTSDTMEQFFEKVQKQANIGPNSYLIFGGKTLSKNQRGDDKSE